MHSVQIRRRSCTQCDLASTSDSRARRIRPRSDIGRVALSGQSSANTLSTESEPRDQPSHGVVPGLDGIRALAIGVVFGLHLARKYFPGGGSGVDVFFVLSAFLITSGLLYELDTKGAIRFSDFYFRRAFRLAPALLLWLPLAVTTAVLAGAGSQVIRSAIGTVGYVSDFFQVAPGSIATAFDQTWSLAVEEQFYLAWPMLLVGVYALTVRRERGRILVGLLVAGAVATQAITSSAVTANYFLPTGHIAALAAGCVAAGVAARPMAPWLRTTSASKWSASAAVGICGVYTLLAPSPFLVWALLIDVASVLLIFHALVGSHSYVIVVLCSRVVRWIGQRSYGIYLYGLTLIQTVPLLVRGIPLHVAAFIDIAVTLLVAEVSFRWVERPVRRAGRHWLRERGRRRHADAVPDATLDWSAGAGFSEEHLARDGG
ncbi:MAG: acyltransferase [Chloroflexi bacterium]|nr:MAG: acyltransferase [Chloroflexota bacterium]